jgi:N-acetylmuramoyl-L-alanine amidase
MLRTAVDENVDLVEGRLPKRLRRRARFVALSRWRLSQAAFAASVLLVAGGIGRSPGSARTPLPAAPAPPETRDAGSAPVTGPTWSALSPVRPDLLRLGIRRVIIDAGHGGDNLGTSSRGGLVEKDVTIDIAERLRTLALQRGFEVVMTRTADDTVSLRGRTAIANQQRGDIFVSIHLNSIRPRSARGIETYYLGPGDGQEQDTLAAAENQHSGYSLADLRTMLDRIYADARREESRQLAETVHRALVDTLQQADPAITDRGVKTAPFVVLVGTDMPAILAEVSCLSNDIEADRLKTAGYRERIAEALASGIQHFAGRARGSEAERTGTHGN